MTDFRPVPSDRLATWWELELAGYADDLAASDRDPDWIAAELDRTTASFFPDGRLAEGHHADEILVDGVVAGHLWTGPLAPDPDGDPDPAEGVIWYVFGVDVGPGFRGRGAGRAAMLEAERLGRAAGMTGIGLAVRADNTVARGLYSSLGYAVVRDNGTRVRMAKPL